MWFPLAGCATNPQFVVHPLSTFVGYKVCWLLDLLLGDGRVG
jgi:hypothetical protein